MKVFDPTLELVACGSRHTQHADLSAMGGRRPRRMLRECRLYLAAQYWDNWDDDYLNFLAKSVPVDRYIQTVGGVIDYVKAKKRSKHDVHISFDEWNVWYHTPQAGRQRWRRLQLAEGAEPARGGL